MQKYLFCAIRNLCILLSTRGVESHGISLTDDGGALSTITVVVLELFLLGGGNIHLTLSGASLHVRMCCFHLSLWAFASTSRSPLGELHLIENSESREVSSPLEVNQLRKKIFYCAMT